MKLNFLRILLLVLVCYTQYSLQTFGTRDCIRQPNIPSRPVRLPPNIIRQEQNVVQSMINNWRHLFRSSIHTLLPRLMLRFRVKRSISRTRFSVRPIRLVRKEYRQMTHTELNRFHQALQQLKNSRDNSNYDRFVDIHDFTRSPAAHFGVSFIMWHRHYLHLLERRLQRMPYCGTLTIPYWDMALDADLPNPSDSCLWTTNFFGTDVGTVTSGLGRYWRVTEKCRETGEYLARNVSGNRDFLFSRTKIANIFTAKNLFELMGVVEGMPLSQLELDHGLVHCFVGGCTQEGCLGHIGCVPCSPNDPIFWMVHSFVDLLWEEWSQLPNRDNTYPVPGVNGATEDGIGGKEFLRDAPMSPFTGLTNNDGLRKNYYTGYTTRPSKLSCMYDSDCKSPLKLLFCHRCECFCKIKEGGNCKGFGNNACYCTHHRMTGYCNQRTNICQCNYRRIFF